MTPSVLHNLVVEMDLYNTAASQKFWLRFVGFLGQQGETSCLVQSSPRRSLDPNLFRVHRTGVFDPSFLHGRAAGEVLQRPHCGCNTSQVQQGMGISEVKWEKRRVFFLLWWRGCGVLTVGLPLRASCGCFSWSYLCYCWPQLRCSHCWVLRYYAEAIDFGRGAVFVLYDELRML